MPFCLRAFPYSDLMGLFSAAVSAVRQGLSRTREALGGSLRSLLHGRSLSPALIDDIEAILLKADVGVGLTNRLIDALRQSHEKGEVTKGEDALEFLKRQLKSSWDSSEASLTIAQVSPTVILVAGVNGAGKTTSVAKIAQSLCDDGRSVLLAAADTYRAGAVEQLTIWAERLGVDIVKGTTGADPASVAFDACAAAKSRGVDVLLIDTAGRLHTQQNLMRQLTKIRDVVRRQFPDSAKPDEVLLVLDATTGQNALQQARIFQDSIEVTGIFLAKLDGTAKGGIALTIRDELGVPVKLIGVGETPEDVEPFDAESFVEQMFA